MADENDIVSVLRAHVKTPDEIAEHIQELGRNPTAEMHALSREIAKLIEPYITRAYTVMEQHGDFAMLLSIQFALQEALLQMRASQIFATGCCLDHNLLRAHEAAQANVPREVKLLQQFLIRLDGINKDEGTQHHH